jgi:hypothetical protein
MAVVVNLLTPSVGWNANKESRRRFGDNALQETGSLPTVIFFANCFFSTLGKEVPLPTRISCGWQRIAVGKGRPWLTPSTPSPLLTATPSAVGKGAGFANCHPPWQSAKNFYFF